MASASKTGPSCDDKVVLEIARRKKEITRLEDMIRQKNEHINASYPPFIRFGDLFFYRHGLNPMLEGLEATKLLKEILSLEATIRRKDQLIAAVKAETPACIQFAHLPAELRIKIWKATLSPRIIMVGDRLLPGDIVISRVCAESREIFQKLYPKCYPKYPWIGLPYIERPVYINLALDTISPHFFFVALQ